MAWEVNLHPEVEAWYLAVCKSDPETADLIEDAITSWLPMAPPSGGRSLTGQGQPLPQHEGAAAAVVRR